MKFSVVRYGNVMGSRGSVIPFFLNLKQQGLKEFPITDERMTRFWITLEQSVELVLKALGYGVGGECFIPIIPSMRIVDLARAIDPAVKYKIIGIRPGEKLHESLISEDEGYNIRVFQGTYVILPQFIDTKEIHDQYALSPKVPEGFLYRSDINKEWITAEQLGKLLKTLC